MSFYQHRRISGKLELQKLTTRCFDYPFQKNVVLKTSAILINNILYIIFGIVLNYFD